MIVPAMPVNGGLPPVRDVPTGKCHPDPNNQRKVYQLDGLKASIAREGILQPLGMWFDAAKDCFFTMWGNSRLLCAIDLGLPTVPARVWDRPLSRLEIAKYQAAENLARTELRPSERAATYRELMELENLAAKDVAAQWGVHAATVSRYLTVLDHPPDIIALIDDGTLGLSASAALARLSDEQARREMVQQIRDGQLSRDKIEEAVQARIGKRPSKPRNGRLSWCTGTATVAITGEALTAEGVLETLQAMAKRVRKLMTDGQDIAALAEALRRDSNGGKAGVSPGPGEKGGGQ